MNTTVTDKQVRQLAETAQPYSMALLWWGPERHKDGADATEREHQRRMVSLRADGVIAILCPVGSDTLSGVAIMTVPPEKASEILHDDHASNRDDALRGPPVLRLPRRHPAGRFDQPMRT